MNQQQRIKLISHQSRAYNEGIVEYINSQWVFFNDETDEASPLEEFINQEVELYRGNRWRSGILLDDGGVKLSKEIVYLFDQEEVKIRKHVQFSFGRLLEELHDDSFFQFIMTLNSLDFSIYDCIYGYNQLTFLREQKNKSGVNFFIFDNGETICSVQHHFVYSTNAHDRFEFTLNTGKRIVIEKLNK
ncbi:DUF2777 family protein [Peribacillus acanthi]|uniref:DUF2777 family protein n=1 Tax=Peribacillus acanthi TaxID=2171554 RepID=UPI000D3ED0F8|nr:DUF2777 family protein [Peribacillus acanthi]